jgi:anti-sigma factor RsiW
LGRPFEKHIDNEELEALAPSPPETGQDLSALSPDIVQGAARHVAFCPDCSEKLSKYRRLVSQSWRGMDSPATTQEPHCPTGKHVDWHEVAAGLWPERKARQLIMHAALCDECGPLLRGATLANDGAAKPEHKSCLVARPQFANASRNSSPSDRAPRTFWRQIMSAKVLVPTLALIVIAGGLAIRRGNPSTDLAGSKFAAFVVSIHRQHAQGNLLLDVRADSERMLNEWFKSKSQFSLALPVSAAGLAVATPYRLEGARSMQVGDKTAVYIAYEMATGPVSLIVTPNSVAVASGGVTANFKKVSFHYGMVEGFKVVTWSVHGLTYALVSQEGPKTQQSCMICHSAMKDRDLTNTPSPLYVESRIPEPPRR